MARSKASRKRRPQPHARIKRVSRWRVVPHTGDTDDDTGVFFPDFPSAADYCMDNDIPYLFEEDTTGQTPTLVWIVGFAGDNVSMSVMPFGDFMAMYAINPFICPCCHSPHLHLP